MMSATIPVRFMAVRAIINVYLPKIGKMAHR